MSVEGESQISGRILRQTQKHMHIRHGLFRSGCRDMILNIVMLRAFVASRSKPLLAKTESKTK
jgi:hypothetical protein